MLKKCSVLCQKKIYKPQMKVSIMDSLKYQVPPIKYISPIHRLSSLKNKNLKLTWLMLLWMLFNQWKGNKNQSCCKCTNSKIVVLSTMNPNFFKIGNSQMMNTLNSKCYNRKRLTLTEILNLTPSDYDCKLQIFIDYIRVKQILKLQILKNYIIQYYQTVSLCIQILKMSLKDFEIISKLGDGAYSTVYKVNRKEDNKTYALKRVKMAPLSTKQKQNALNQIRILASIKNNNVISYKQAFVDEATKSLCIVMEFANNGDLGYKIQEKKKKNQLFTQNQIWDLFIQVVKGLNALHQHNIFHRDIKPANVFLHEENGIVQSKLGDMNVSKISEKGLCMTQTGTPYYASPEVWKDKPYDFKSDIWSLGCVLYEMITLQPPFRSQDMQGLYKKVIRGIYPRIPPQFSQDLSSMIRSLLQVNPEMRPSCQKILKMALVIKKMKNQDQNQDEKVQLLRTIRAGQSFSSLNQNLPKANYLPPRTRKQKGIKSLIETIQQNGMHEVDSLPILQKQKKLKAPENSDRLMLKQKQSINMLTRDRKKSQMAIDRNNRMLQINSNSKSVNHNNLAGIQIKELKLPKVQQNRYSKGKQKINKQNSLRNHKIYQ